MKNYLDNIQKVTLENENFRKVLFTGKSSQLVVMCLQPNENIGLEVHQDTDQFFRIEKGNAKITMDGETHEVKDGFAFIVSAKTQHDLINTSSSEPLKLYTIYSPPNHPKGTIHKTKLESKLAEDH